MKIVETWRLFFQFYFLTSEGTGSAIREATQHEEKIPLLLASTLTASMLLSACSYQKDDAKAKGKRTLRVVVTENRFLI